MAAEKLRLGDFAACTTSLGPGKRAVVWVRGCSLNCPGCTTPQLIPPGDVREHGVRTEEVIARIMAAKAEHGIEGVSFSGGEPFEQAKALLELARASRKAGLTVISWSGYTLEELRASGLPGAAELLAELDALIDGRYVREKRAALPLRGSSNQRIHLFSRAYGPGDFATCDAEFRFAPDGSVKSIGILDDREARVTLKLLGVE